MHRKIVAVWMSIMIVVGFVVIVDVVTDFTPTVEATTLYVNETGSNGSYTSIQNAINAANDGDTVFVYNGTYYENIVVNKLINLIGENREYTIIDGGGNGNVIHVSVNWVNISTLRITNAGYWDYGIRVESSYNTISDSNVIGSRYGVVLRDGTTKNRVFNNTVFGRDSGILVHYCGNHYIENNTIEDCGSSGGFGHGIWCYQGSSNYIANNSISNNRGVGVYFELGSSNNKLRNNTFINDGIGLSGILLSDFVEDIDISNTVNGKLLYYFYDQTNIIFDSNDAGQVIFVYVRDSIIKNINLSNTDFGIFGAKSTNIIIENCTFYSDYMGIKFDQDNTNINIINITIANSDEHGFMAADYSKSIVLNNCSIMNSNNKDIVASYDSVITSLNSSYGKSKVSTGGGNAKFTALWYLNVYVNYSTGVPFPGANVIVEDNRASEIFNGFTDISGFCKWIKTTEYVQVSSGKYYYTPHRVIAKNDTHYGMEDGVRMNESKTVYITLDQRKIVHNLNTNKHFIFIQKAIDDTETVNGHTIFIDNGTCYENVIIDKSIILSGEERNNTIIDGNGIEDTVKVVINGVTVTNLTIKNGGSSGDDAGLRIDSDQNTIYGNYITSNSYGLYLYKSNNNFIKNNILINNFIGCAVRFSSDNVISGNHIGFNDNYGVYLFKSPNTDLTNNIFNDDGIFIEGDQLSHYNSHNIFINNLVNGKPVYYYKNSNSIDINGIPIGQIILVNCSFVNISNIQINNTDVGVESCYSSNISIIGNNFFSNYHYGIFYYLSSFGKIIGNNVSSNMNEAIYMYESDFNYVTDNIVLNNTWSITVMISIGNNILRNNVTNNDFGIFLAFSHDSYIYHNNIIDNGLQVDDNSNRNQWDNGYPSGGNYWSNYLGNDLLKGPNQDIPGHDGIGDTKLTIDFDSSDRYPLMEPYINKQFENYTTLQQGWNLISIPLIQSNQDLSKVLEMINGYYDAVQWHDNSDADDPWKHHKVGKPFGNDLFELNESMGFWIHITLPGETIFIYNGTQPTSNQTIQLHKGWNMVGYPSLTNYNRTAGLNNLEFGTDVDAIQWYDAASQSWHFMDQDDSFVPGRGYWMHSKVTKTWEVPL